MWLVACFSWQSLVMNTTGISTLAWTPYRPNLDGTITQRFEHFNAFRRALQSGGLPGAQNALTAFQKDIQKALQNLAGGGATIQHAQATENLQTLGDALNSGDMQSAQQAFAALKRDLQAAYANYVQPKAATADTTIGVNPPLSFGVKLQGGILNTYA